MRDIKIVIGANFGDEGKGLMTDYFCHQAEQRNEKCIVVLHNGGAQRGHTVTTPTGIKHIFHHFGSGTFCGADTYCSKDFILNPMIFSREFEELKVLGYEPKVYIHPLCKISTPFDMILNQIVEEHRSGKRHGSCGVGIYETLLRIKEDKYSIFFGELFFLTDEQIRSRLQTIRDEWMKTRFRMEDIEFISNEWANIINSSSLIDHYLIDLKFMRDISVKANNSILSGYKNIVFENGQGLLLDQNNTEYYPHLTPSNTGCKNALDIISKSFPNKQNLKIEACYVTRTYLTRHGAGRLDNECRREDINNDMFDHTNLPNPHQGTLRYGHLITDNLMLRILEDFKLLVGQYSFNSTCSLAMTHINEYIDDDVWNMNYEFEKSYFGYSESRDGIRERERLKLCVMGGGAKQ